MDSAQFVPQLIIANLQYVKAFQVKTAFKSPVNQRLIWVLNNHHRQKHYIQQPKL